MHEYVQIARIVRIEYEIKIKQQQTVDNKIITYPVIIISPVTFYM
jgi:hypothetical protein